MISSSFLFFVQLCVLCIAKDSLTLEEYFFRRDYQYSPRAQGWFKLHRLRETWFTARLQCYFEGANLASPVDANHWIAIRNIQNESKLSALHSGVHATFSNGVFTSVEGVPIDDLAIQWAPNEPRYNESEQCTAYYEDGMGISYCDTALPYLCFKKYSPDDKITECGTMDKEYKLFNNTGHCYKYHAIVHTWAQAMRICQAEGGYLCIINNDAEAGLLEQLFAQNPPLYAEKDLEHSIFLGYKRWRPDLELWTIHGKTLEESGYAKWASGEPNGLNGNEVGQSCGAMYHSGELDDYQCEARKAFVCEKTVDSLTIPNSPPSIVTINKK